jgi:hypothetical protein
MGRPRICERRQQSAAEPGMLTDCRPLLLKTAPMDDLLRLLSENKVWWITPIVIVLGLVAYLIYSGDGQAPAEGSEFVYELY